MNCGKAFKLITPYLEGGVDESEALALEQHVSVCESCARTLCVAKLLSTPAAVAEPEPSSGNWQDELDYEAFQDNPATVIAHTIIYQAFKDGASEIRVEPTPTRVRVMERIGGELTESMTIPKYVEESLFKRIKQMANLKSRRPGLAQKGDIPIRAEGRDFTVEVSVIPCEQGERLLLKMILE